MAVPGHMGALGSNDALKLFFTWMMGSRSLNSWRSERVGGWHAATVSRSALGLFGAGAHLQLRHFLSKSLHNSRSHQSSQQHWRQWSPFSLTGNGGQGLPYNMSLGLLMSSPWSSWYLGPQGQSFSDSSGKFKLAAVGDDYTDGSPAPSDNKNQFPRRNLTNFLLGLNILVFVAQAATQGKLLLLGAKVGALAVFLLRHKNMMVGGQRSLKQVGRIIVLNMVLGLSSAGIDNWSHFGGLLGGAAVTWLLGPVYSFETPPGGGKRQLVDRPPISYLIPVRSTRNL